MAGVRRQAIVFGLLAAMAICLSACGDDEDNPANGDTGGAAAAPAPSEAFGGLSEALEAQGLQVMLLPKGSRHGAEVGVKITGSKSGTALLFSTEQKAKDYAEVAQNGGDKTTTVGTAVFQAPTQADANYFADAYEGG